MHASAEGEAVQVDPDVEPGEHFPAASGTAFPQEGDPADSQPHQDFQAALDKAAAGVDKANAQAERLSSQTPRSGSSQSPS
jgi:hypothetical protein